MALSKTTQDHDEIRQWAEKRGGKPAEVASTERSGETGIIRLMFPSAPHHNDGSLKEISWDDFFEKFDKSGLALVYQEQTADGEQSDFNRLIHPENASPSASTDTSSTGSAGAKKSSTAKRSSSGAAKKTTGTKSATKGASAKSTAAKSSKKASATKAAPSKAAKKAPVKRAVPNKAAKKVPAG